jgi:hypothetical protein
MFLNLHESMGYVVILPAISEAALETVFLCVRASSDQLMQQDA